MGFRLNLSVANSGSKIKNTEGKNLRRGHVGHIISAGLGNASQSKPFRPGKGVGTKERWNFKKHNEVISTTISSDGNLQIELEKQIINIKNQIHNKAILKFVDRCEGILFSGISENKFNAVGPNARMGVVYFCACVSKYEYDHQLSLENIVDIIKAGIEEMLDKRDADASYVTQGLDYNSFGVRKFTKNVYVCADILDDIIASGRGKSKKMTK